MKKTQYENFNSKDSAFRKKAKLYIGLYILIMVVLFSAMFMIPALKHFVTFIVILVIFDVLFHLVFKEYIMFFVKQKEMARINLHQQFPVGEEVIEYFNENAFQNLYDDDFALLQKNDVYFIATKKLENTIYDLALSVYFIDLKTEAVSPTLRELAREMNSYLVSTSVIKVILIVANIFSDDDKEILKYDSQGHRNTVVIGLEKDSKLLYYNYFLNGEILDEVLSKQFKVDLTKKESDKE